MLQANVPADPNRQIPLEVEMSSIGKLTESFKTQYGTFSDREDEDIVKFARNADEFMRRNLTPSLEMGWIILHNLEGEPYMRAMRWRNSGVFDPKKIHADHWSHQPYQAATPLIPNHLNSRGHLLCNYCGIPSHPRSACRHRIRDLENGIIRNNHPAKGTMSSDNQTGEEARAGLTAATDQENLMRPNTPAIREQPAVDANHCLKAYLLHTFRKRIEITTANENLTTLISQKPKQTYGSNHHT